MLLARYLAGQVAIVPPVRRRPTVIFFDRIDGLVVCQRGVGHLAVGAGTVVDGLVFQPKDIFPRRRLRADVPPVDTERLVDMQPAHRYVKVTAEMRSGFSRRNTASHRSRGVIVSFLISNGLFGYVRLDVRHVCSGHSLSLAVWTRHRWPP